MKRGQKEQRGFVHFPIDNPRYSNTGEGGMFVRLVVIPVEEDRFPDNPDKYWMLCCGGTQSIQRDECFIGDDQYRSPSAKLVRKSPSSGTETTYFRVRLKDGTTHWAYQVDGVDGPIVHVQKRPGDGSLLGWHPLQDVEILRKPELRDDMTDEQRSALLDPLSPGEVSDLIALKHAFEVAMLGEIDHFPRMDDAYPEGDVMDDRWLQYASIPYLAVITLGSTSWTGYDEHLQRTWVCQIGDLTPEGKLLYQSMLALYGDRGRLVLQTWLDT